MFKFIKLATKNVFRNRRRTIITGLVLVFGATALILAGGFISFSFRGLSESTIRGQLGHIQLYTKEALQREEERPLELGIDSVDALKKKVYRSGPRPLHHGAGGVHGIDFERR